MAIDTRNKRGSVIGMGLSLVLPLADGVIEQADRQQTSRVYAGILADFPIPVISDDVVSNLPVFFQNSALKRTAEVAVADWEGGMNMVGSCAVGIGINTANVSVPSLAQFTLLDQSPAARVPQLSQNIGQGTAEVNAVRGELTTETLNFVTATQEAAPEAIFDASSGTVNRTGGLVKVGDTAWGTST